MPEFLTTNGHTQIIVPLTITPFNHQATPTITGSLFGNEAGAVLYGHYMMEYLFPEGDRLRLIANHDKKNVQLMLFTHQADLIKKLPGEYLSSLVANIISIIHRYCIRSANYSPPLSPEQKQKLQIANECITALNKLLQTERKLNNEDHIGKENLRKKIFAILEQAGNKNRLLTINPIVSEGFLGELLLDAHKIAQHYSFNRVYAVSPQDQMDFNHIKSIHGKKPCFVWDSDLHLGQNNTALDDALRVICQHYHLNPSAHLSNIPANRFAMLAAFFRKLWHDSQDWVNYVASDTQAEHKTEVEERLGGISITHITPYYSLQGPVQKGYVHLDDLITQQKKTRKKPHTAHSIKQAQKILSRLDEGHWVIIAKQQLILMRQGNTLTPLRYFAHEALFYPLPEGEDLYILGQISKRHLYMPERVKLRLQAFASRIPSFFYHFYQSMYRFIVHDLHKEFVNYIHRTHQQPTEAQDKIEQHKARIKKRHSLVMALEGSGLLTNGQTLEEFIHTQLSNSPYVIARPNHPPSPPTYDNPLHRTLSVLRHFAGFFIDMSQRDPIVGTLAMAAYAYGGGAILAPEMLKNVLNKLHLHGLISGIEPTQKLAHWMSHGTFSEAVSASVLYWQGAIIGGNLDKFFIEAIKVLKDDPAEIAIISALALSLGYGMTKLIPPLAHEMGEFPYTNYAALGGKGGAAIYDTIMHPGDDWFLGTCKWLCKGLMTLAKLFIAPFIEAYYYGYHDGFLQGWQKSKILALKVGKHLLAACIDLVFAVLTIPLLEVSSLFIYVPLHGLSNLVIKLLATLGNFGALGNVLLAFASRAPLDNVLAHYRLSPLYGFSNPLGHFSENIWINGGLNALRVLFYPPLQLLKNLIALPLIDLTSLIVRVGIMIIDPLSRIASYSLGYTLLVLGVLWDQGMGRLFHSSATGLMILMNWCDTSASEIKQNLLSSIENTRSELFHWAFGEEDMKCHSSIHDEEYYLHEPKRYELLPHSKSYCLLHELLDTNHSVRHHTTTEIMETQSNYENLFAPPTPKNKEQGLSHSDSFLQI